jgi:hypothetical protein
MHSIVYTTDLSFTNDIYLTIHIQNLKQCALYTIMNLNQELFYLKNTILQKYCR